ncbi:MAG: hypothetical protein ABIB04_01840 [Patescibacteria group bacterium]
MSEEISLLPNELRKKEDAIRHPGAEEAASAGSELNFSVPKEEGEDIEIIEIDEGEIEQVLENEPLLTRIAYRFTTAIEDLKNHLFKQQEIEPPPKLPPQFFTPPEVKEKPLAKEGTGVAPKPGLPVTEKPGAPPPVAPSLAPLAAPAVTKVKAKITPFEKGTRRVRVIKRIRKPVRVSFVSEEDLRMSRIDIPRRRFTFITIAVLGGILLGGSAYLLKGQHADASTEMQKATKQLQEVRSEIADKNQVWSSFKDLEPKLKALTGLLSQHVSMLHLLEQLEKTTLPTVSYQSMNLGADKRITLAVVANSFETAASQITLFEQAGFITKVETSGYTAVYDPPDSYIPKSVEFQVYLTLSDDALRTSSSTMASLP